MQSLRKNSIVKFGFINTCSFEEAKKDTRVTSLSFGNLIHRNEERGSPTILFLPLEAL